MGRGRAKAKQTKVARELKYSSPTMDLDALQREIGSGTAHGTTVNGTTMAATEPDVEDDAEYTYPGDPYAAYLDDDEDVPRR